MAEQIEEPEEKNIIRLESTVKDYEELVWNRDTENIYINEVKLFDSGVGGFIIIDGVEYEVRMPNRQLIKVYTKLRRRMDIKTKTIKISDAEAFRLEDTMDAIMIDMILGFDPDNPEIRIDELEYNLVAGFCWEFYGFFAKQSRLQTTERASSRKERKRR